MSTAIRAPRANESNNDAAPTRVKALTTPKGLCVWHVEDYTVPLVSLQFAFLGGAAQDPAARPGLANLLSGVLDEGAGDLDSNAYQERLEEQAVEISFDAGRDRFGGAMRTLTRNIDEAFALLALAINAPRFDEDAVERVRAQVIASIRRDENEPQVVARETFNARAFPGHPYARPVYGSVTSVGAAEREDIIERHRALFARANLRLAAVGAISSDRLMQLVDRAFGDLPEAPALTPIEDVALAGRGSIHVSDLDVPQSTLLFALPGIRRLDPDFPAATVVNHIFGGGSFTSRLWTEVREKRGLAYSVWSQLAPAHHGQLLMGGTATSNERMAESLAVIEAEIGKLAAAGPDADELEKAKRYLIGSYALRFDTSRKIASHLVDLQVDGLGIDHLGKRNAEIAAVELEDAHRLSARLFADPRMTIVIAGRPAGIEPRGA